LEIFNAGPTNVPLAGWRLTGDIDFSFPTNAILGGGRYLVVAKNPARLASIPQYGLNVTNIAGPYNGQLSNGGGTVRLRDAADNTIDSVSFSAEFPWAISADALGADDEWTGLNSTNFQYRGRSLERSSLTWPANDPANWLASPVGGNPSPAEPTPCSDRCRAPWWSRSRLTRTAPVRRLSAPTSPCESIAPSLPPTC